MTAPHSRPRVVTAAFWCWLVASLMLIVGGLFVAFVPLPVVYRGAGGLTALAGAAVAYLAGRSRDGDERFRRAAIVLSLTVIVLVAISAVVGVVHMLTLIAVLPLVAGTVLITRPAAAKPAEQEPQ
jgi:hypothetical protein